jgi:AraC-like DNA-binding protein
LQLLQKTTTYQPEEHADPCLSGSLKLLGQGHPIGTVKSCVTDQAFIRRRETFTTTLEEGEQRNDWITFSLRDASSANFFTQNQRVTSLETMAIVTGDQQFRQITLPDTVVYTFGIKTNLLKRDPRLELLGIKIPAQHCILKIRGSLRHNVISKLELLLKAGLEDQEFHMELTDLATTLISSTSLNEVYQSVSTRSRIVARAAEAIRNADPRILNPTIIANLSFTSVRTLEYAFQEVLVMTPKQYIDYYRINLLRQRLIDTPQIPLSQLGDEVGLPHLSKHYKHYKQLYGETPSGTKKRLARL